MIAIVNQIIGMASLEDSNMKGVGIEKRRCLNCENLQEVISIDGAITIFFRCDKCDSEVFIEDNPQHFTSERLFIDTT